ASLREATQRALTAARSEGETRDTAREAPPDVIRLPDQDDAELILEVSLLPQWEAGTLRGLTGVARDITLREQAAEQLRLAASVFEGTREGILIMDSERRIIEVNQAACSFTDYADHELEGRGVCDLLCDTSSEPGFCEALWK
ncbi:PAS domain S-box protein, partial [Arthrospira platensis SPKY1]|nr:PAS domain S-box protein [Arthrospira platensis SPKY1]